MGTSTATVMANTMTTVATITIKGKVNTTIMTPVMAIHTLTAKVTIITARAQTLTNPNMGMG